jgi:hypothetical protein
MEILRVPPYPITATWDVPEANADYTIYLEDLVDHSYENIEIVSDDDSQINYVMPQSKVQFDREFLFRVYDENNEIVIDSNLTVYRPYVDPNILGNTDQEVAEYKELEIVARGIIDSYMGTSGGFYNHKLVIQQVGQGTDYFPIWHDTNRVLKVYENNVLVYDAENPDDYATGYEITADGTAITMSYPDAVNRDESARLLLPASPTDIVEFNYAPRGFPKGWDYKIVVEAGFKKVPGDIKRAAELLIHDIDCGKLDYYKRYIGSYNTDQFRIQFDKAVFEGTGNLIVDKILLKYEKSIKFVGVL